MKKRSLCLLLALALCLGWVRAAGEELFPAVNSYPGYADVRETAWYYDNIRLCNEVGLMNGTDKGFEPEKTLTVAECAAVAARIREKLTGEAIPGVTPLPGQTLPWYQQYLGYMNSADAALTAMLARPEEPCSRMEYLQLLNAALPSEQGLLSAINSITSLPDTDDETVLAFYNAGILTGVNNYGTFDGDKTLTRAEAAAMVSRIVRPELRQSFTPEPPAPTLSGSGTAMTVNGREVDADTFINILCSLVYDWDAALYRQTGAGLDWSNDYGTGDLRSYLLNLAAGETVRYSLLLAKAEELGCSATSELPSRLFPDPGRETLGAYAQERGLLCAKHILVGDMDTANAVLDGLKVVPTLDQFNALLTVFGTDPGMTAQPDGYLFGAGEMVSEFESGVKALAFDSYTTEPVQSSYGYHIIWRLDPAAHPQMLAQYQYGKTMELLETWFGEAQVVLNDGLLSGIDPKACYESFLNG